MLTIAPSARNGAPKSPNRRILVSVPRDVVKSECRENEREAAAWQPCHIVVGNHPVIAFRVDIARL